MRFAQAYVALEGALAKLAGALVLLAVMLITVNAMMRYALNAPINWVDQFSGYFLVYATFLAAPWVLAKRGHVRGDIGLGPADGQAHLIGVVQPRRVRRGEEDHRLAERDQSGHGAVGVGAHRRALASSR